MEVAITVLSVCTLQTLDVVTLLLTCPWDHGKGASPSQTSGKKLCLCVKMHKYIAKARSDLD